MVMTTGSNPKSLEDTKPKKPKKQSYVKKAKILSKPKKVKQVK
jgi:hypothetical protein